jgi:glucose dehydrogenase
MVRPERNGYVYVLDRVTGEVLSADPFVHITTTKGVDLKSGRPILAPYKERVVGKVVREICPASPGAKDWQPSAYSPRTGLLYIPHNNLCQDAEGVEANGIAGPPSAGANVRLYAGPGGNRGAFTAWDPVGRRPVWSVREHFPAWSGALVTAGDVVFYGTLDGWFKALDARSGKELWKLKVGSGSLGQPVSYRGPDGKQYVAMLSGQADPRATNALQDLPDDTTRGGRLSVFALP